MVGDHGDIPAGEEQGGGEGDPSSWFAGNFTNVSTKSPREPLSPGQTRVVGHPGETSLLSSTN